MRQAPLGGRREFAACLRHLFCYGVVIAGRSYHGHVLKIFGGGANHGWPTNIDVLDEVFKGHARLGSSLLERIKIDHHHVNRLNTVLGHRAAVRGILAPVQNASMHLGVEGFNAPVEHLGEAGEFGNVLYADARVAQQFGGAAGGNKFHAQAGEFPGELHQSCFVGHAEDGTFDLGLGHGRASNRTECAWERQGNSISNESSDPDMRVGPQASRREDNSDEERRGRPR